jgi:hypothetical protein
MYTPKEIVDNQDYKDINPSAGLSGFTEAAKVF